MSKILLAVITDSISNSVFESQVLIPLVKRQQQSKYDRIIVISFEQKRVNQLLIDRLIASYPITLIIRTILPFFGKISLQLARLQLRSILGNYPGATIIARGPLAGYLAIKSKTATQSLTVQARGLLAEEYAYTHQHTINVVKKLINQFRYRQFFAIEKTVYGSLCKQNATIEAVSCAMKKYLMQMYHAPQSIITIAAIDMPEAIAQHQKTAWCNAQRAKLGIPAHAQVFCYSGSLKSWQCPLLTAQFVKTKMAQNPEAFFLMLTNEPENAQRLLHDLQLETARCRILNAPQQELYQYLAASNYGIIFREEHLINWVSRPTKILEYQSVGLEIIHNHTIGILCDK